MRNSIMSGNKQSNCLRSNTSLTLLLFFSTSQYHCYSPRHDDLDQYGTATCSTHRSQGYMFNGATSFNQDVSTWDTSSATSFVSGLGPWDSAACWCRLRRRVFRLLEHCRCCSWYDHGCWHQHGCFVAHACNTIVVMLMRNSIMSGNKQTILRSNTSLTLLLFFSTISQYHHYSPRQNGLDKYGTTTGTCSTLSCTD